MACYLLAAVALTAALVDRSWFPLFRSALAAALGIGLVAFYLLPALIEQRWIDVSQLTIDPLDQVENRMFFPRHLIPDLISRGPLFPGRFQPEIAFLILTMVAVAVAGLLIARRRGLIALRWWLPLGLIPVAVLFLQFPISLPLWNLLPKLRLLQFPWRWLVVLEAPMAILFAAALWPPRQVRRYAVVALSAALFLASILFTNHFFFGACQVGDSVPEMMSAYRSGLGFDGVNEYAPPGADDAQVASGLPDACLAASPTLTLGILDVPGSNPDWWVEQGTCAATYSGQSSQPERHRLHAVLPRAGFLILRLRSYPAWRILLNGQPVVPVPRADDGLIAVPVPQGEVSLTVDWRTTPDVLFGRSVSALSALLLAALWFCTRKPRRPRLS
jgi:hypothetical protein